jgi:uncharacterized protein (DUF2342 family)
VSSSVGAEKRDQLWDHPDLLPTSEDIDDAAGFVQRIQKGTDQLDRDLRDLLGE